MSSQSGCDARSATGIAGNAEVIRPLRDEPWGMREFGIRTNDGHRILFGQEIERTGLVSPGARTSPG